MCGILCGNIKSWNYEKGIEALKHRGPDAQKVMAYPLFTMAFARLSIIDISDRAMQPMESADGNVVIAFNGEIYGFQNLKSKLEKKYDFKTTSDTEIILYAYMEFGDSFIDLIDGMFAIAIYDKRTETVRLYRDRCGIKPIYYYLKGTQFAFASELKAIMAAGGSAKWDLEPTALLDFLCYQYIPEPKSLYKDIYKLEPAHFMEYDLRERRLIRKGKYWRLHINTRAEGKRKKDEITGTIRSLLQQSIREQMAADVPVGTYLSGGIDSSIIAYESSRVKEDILAFTIGFKEKKADESQYARLLAITYGMNQITKVISSDDIKKTIGMLKDFYDEPFADTSAYPTYLLSKLAREYVTVVLTGDGGDELFGGYNRYALFGQREKECLHDNYEFEKRVLNIINRLPDFAHEIIGKNLTSKFSAYCRIMKCFDEGLYEDWRKVLNIARDYDPRWHLQKYYVKDLPVMTRVRYLDFKTYLPGDILTKIDRASMSVSLEARVPFLSRRVVEYAFSLAENECCSPDNLKKILKEAYSGIIPDEILYRAKKGFSIPRNYIQSGYKVRSTYEAVLQQEWKENVLAGRLDFN